MTVGERPGWPLGAGARHGRVSDFDDDRGVGTVTGDDGQVLPFHCTALTDGSRTVPVGAEVRYLVAPGHFGRLEARDLDRLS